jgi:predicted RNase H-like nuclease (RuvC/YqgF family)
VLYLDSVEENGIQWLKKIFTKAATFVRSPAYGKRTALIALATRQDIDSEEFLNDFISVAHQWAGEDESKKSEEENTQEGGKLMEEELKQALAEAESLKKEIESLTKANEELKTQLETTNAELQKLNKEAIASAREKKYIEAGFALEADAEKAEKKRAFWLSLSDEAFEEYLADLKAAKGATKAAEASTGRKPELPKLAVASGNDKVEYTIESLKAEIRSAARE